MTGIAHQYALAVFSLAEEAGRAEKFIDVLKQFASGLDEQTDKFFIHPKIEKAEKAKILENIIQDQLLLNFLKVLIDNDRFLLIPAIIGSYQDILDNIHKVMKVIVYSKQPLTDKNISKIKEKLHKQYNRTIEIQETIDDTIKGGIRIEFEGNVIDETINKQLENIRSSLLE